jgi:hypothetical protein
VLEPLFFPLGILLVAFVVALVWIAVMELPRFVLLLGLSLSAALVFAGFRYRRRKSP